LAHWSEGPLDWYAEVDKRGKLQVDELELRAEIVADFLTTELYVPSQPYFTRRNIHNHLDIWIGKMKKNPGWIFNLVAAAGEAADFILSFSTEVEPRHRLVQEAA
jgi:hypothetical protein